MAIKSSRGVTSGKGTPQRLEGQNGDITIRSSSSGKKLFVKDANKWHSVNLDINTLNISRQIKLISEEVAKLKVRKNNKPILDKVGLRKSGSTNVVLKNNSADFEIIFDDNNKKIIGSSSSKVVRDVTDGNPSWQIGSSDTENFKIQTTYKSSAKGFNKVSIGTNTASSLINEGQISLNVDGEDKLILNDSAHEILVDGVTASDVDANSQPVGIHIKNKAKHASNTNTRSSIRFSQEMEGVISETFDEVASIVAGSEGTYNSTSSNADGYLSLQTALNGTLTERLKIASNGDVTINNISSGDGSGENFLVEESGIIKKRTAAQTLNDIGAMPDSGDIVLAGTLSITHASNPPLKVAYDSNHFATFDMDVNGVLEIECTDGGSAESKLQLKNGGTTGDQYLVWGNSSETARITSNGAQNLLLDTNEGSNSGYIEINDGANNDIHIAPNGTGLVILGTETGSVQFATNSFLDSNGNPLFGTAVASSAVNNVELGNAATGDPAILKATGTDTNVPLTITTKGTGAVTVDSGGDISLDSASGNFVYKNAGTEFSVENSAFAGTILAYRCIGESTAHTSYTLTNSYAVPSSLMTTRFVAPPSGVVEYEVQAYVDVASNYLLYFALSDASTYNSLGNSYEQLVHKPDETDQSLVTWKVIESGLTAGTTYNRWFGAKVSATSSASKIFYGGTGANRYTDFIFKVTALPHAKATYAVYG